MLEVRNSFEIVRQPWMLKAELGGAPRDPVATHDAVARAYEQRWNKVTDAQTELEAELVEAEVLWGSAALDKMRALFRCRDILCQAVLDYLDELIRPEYLPTLPEWQVEGLSIREVLYSYGTTDNPFSARVQSACTDVEKQLRPYLTARSLRRPRLFRLFRGSP